jgi:uncharacterized protein with NAD-binding domain and iron-sulfur cluster
MEEVGGQWLPWVLDAPVFPGTPGIDEPPSIFGRVVQFLKWVLHGTVDAHAQHFAGKDQHAGLSSILQRMIKPVLHLLHEALHLGELLLLSAIAAIDALDPDLQTHTAEQHHGLASILDELRGWISGQIHHMLDEQAELRHFWILANLGISSLIGGLRDGLLLDCDANLERVNATDYKDWLRSHGADELTVESALVRSLYDLVFAYPEGDWRGPGNVEAGTFFVSLMNTARYQGSLLWKFNTATADLLMVPMYDVLTARGVKIEFFSRVDRLVPSPDGSEIAEVVIGRQVELKNGSYAPLRTLASGQRVWPDRPLFVQIVQGDKLKAERVDLESHWTTWQDSLLPRTIKAGVDYDELVLAIPPAAHRDICAELIVQKPRWRAMTDALQTTATQSLQVWTDASEKDLGWDKPTIIGSFDESGLDTWADISEVLATENWPPELDVKAEQIACGPLPCPAYPPPRSDADYPGKAKAEAEKAANDFLYLDGHDFWSKRFGPNGPIPGTVVSQYSRANVDPSERYTLTVTNSTRHRLRTCDSGYDNLFLAGDWILNGQNLGSFEATTVSGLLASRAMSGKPKKILRVDAARYSDRHASVMPDAGARPFVEYGGMSTFPGKIELKNTTMWSMMLEADRTRLEDYCRRMFDEPSNGAVRVMPLCSKMFLTVSDFGHGRFVDASYMGWSRERELTFWIPAVRVREEDGRTVATHFDMVLPYLVLDNPAAIASGREIFGFFKQSGSILLPGDPGHGDDLAIDLFATRKFGPDSEQRLQRFVTLSPVQGNRPAARVAVGSFEDGFKALHEHLAPSIGKWNPSLDLASDLFSCLLKRQVPQLFLKQFRDVSDSRLACYQAITQAMGHVDRFTALPELLEFDMTIEHLDSSPVAEEFGIVPRQTVLAAKFEFDMSLDSGTVLWKA